MTTTKNNVAAQAGDEPTWMTSDLSYVLAHLKENTIFDTARIQREWDEMKALAIQARVSPRATADVEREKLPHGHRDDFYLMANARGLAMNSIHTVRSMPNWVLAVKLFATGSTSAHEICAKAGIDPDGISIERATTKPGA